MPTLKGLPGMAQDIECEFFQEAHEVAAIIEKGKAATEAGENGAINVYKDDAGFICCELQVFCSQQDFKTFEHLESAMNWIERNLEIIR